MTKIAFNACEEVTIVGVELDCECSHCGRPLKVGVKLAGFSGVFGSDCLSRVAAPYVYGGRKYIRKGETIRQLGIIAHKGADCIRRHGYGPHHFKFVLKNELRSV